MDESSPLFAFLGIVTIDLALLLGGCSSTGAEVGGPDGLAPSSASDASAGQPAADGGDGGVVLPPSGHDGSVGGSCGAKLDGGACVACCVAANPKGAAELYKGLLGCACTPALCESECGSLCASEGRDGGLVRPDGGGDRGDAGSACMTCLETKAMKDPACVDVLTSCSSSPECAALGSCAMGCK